MNEIYQEFQKEMSFYKVEHDSYQVLTNFLVVGQLFDKIFHN